MSFGVATFLFGYALGVSSVIGYVLLAQWETGERETVERDRWRVMLR